MKEYSLYISHHAKKIFGIQRGAINIKEQLKITGYQVVFHKTMNEKEAINFIIQQCNELEYTGELYNSDEGGKAYIHYNYSVSKKPKQSIYQKIKSWLVK